MFEDMIETEEQHMPCATCKERTGHILIELVSVEQDGVVIEVIDSWWECYLCGKRSPYPKHDDGIPF